jgi:hypothetical protein
MPRKPRIEIAGLIEELNKESSLKKKKIMKNLKSCSVPMHQVME